MGLFTVDAAAIGAGTGTAASPWTVAQACAAAVAGDTVNINSGAYTVRITPANAGTAGNLIWFRGTPGQAMPVITPIVLNHESVLFGTDYVRVSGIECHGGVLGTADNVLFSGCSNCILDNCILRDSTFNAVTLQGTGANNVVRNCRLYDVASDGIGTHDAQTNVLIAWNVIEHCGTTVGGGGGGDGDGVSFHDACSGIIEFNYIRRCYKGGITNVQNSGAEVICRFNWISDCVRHGISGAFDGTTIGVHTFVRNIILVADTSATIAGQQPAGIYMGPPGSGTPGTFDLFGNIVVNHVDSNASYNYNAGDAGRYLITMKNNVSLASAAARHIYLTSVALTITLGSTLDNNWYYLDQTVANNFRWGAAAAGDFAAYKTGIGGGNEAHSVADVDPMFIGGSAYSASPGAYAAGTDANRWPAARNPAEFLLKIASTMRAAGTDPGASYRVDARGRTVPATTPDIGAFQYSVAELNTQGSSSCPYALKPGFLPLHLAPPVR